MPVLDLIDVALRVDLPSHVYESQELQTLRLITANMVCWVNDLYSLPKELAHGDTLNLVVILQNAYNCSLEDAIYRVCTMIEDEVRLFIDIEEKHPPHFSPSIDQHVHNYTANLQAMMRGNLDWSRETPRYAQEGFIDSAS